MKAQKEERVAQEQPAEKLLSIEVQKEFDVLEKTWQERVFVKLYVAARSSGLLAAISDKDWKTLCAIATFMDEDGNCYPSQAEIARALGTNRSTANQRIASLIEFRFNGKPVLLKARLRGEKGKFNSCRYTVLPVSNLHIFKGGDEAQSTVFGDSNLGASDTVEPNTVSSNLGNPNTNKNQRKREGCLEEKQQPEEVVVQSSLQMGNLPEETRKKRKEELRAILHRYPQEVIDEALKRTVKAKKKGEVRKDIIRFFGGVCRNVEQEFKEVEERAEHESEKARKSGLRIAAALRDDLIKAGLNKEEIEKELLIHYEPSVVDQVMQELKKESESI